MNHKLIEKINNLISKENGTVFKEPGGRINICLVYPNTYHVGMSNLGFQGIYTLLNERNDVLCERSFFPDDEDIEEYAKTKTELFSLESKRPLNRFDIVAFSVSFENDYPNVLKILKLSNIPSRASDRKASHPLIILGGVCAFFNPEPLADFFDICFIGEAEEMLQEFLEVYKKSETRADIYKKASHIEGVYVPKFYTVRYENNPPSPPFSKGGMGGFHGEIIQRESLEEAPEKIKKQYIKDISSNKFRPSIITPETEFSGMYLIEAMRGCPWQCRFCVAGHIYNPPRTKELNAIKQEISRALKTTKRVGLIGPSLTDYPFAKDVLKLEGVDFSITSLRASRKSAELAGLLKGHKSTSIAPEAGTERLRRVIAKKITEDDIIGTSKLIFAEGMENLRLYFMIGLPTETDEDINGIVNLVKKIRAVSKKGGLTLTLSTFVPKPFTPFQWHPMEKIETVKDRIKTIKKLLLPIKGIRVFHDVPKYAYMQGLFSMGDRRISKVLEAMLKIHDWRKACIDSGIDPDFYMMRKKDFKEALPWDFIDSGISKEKLWDEYQKALSE
ncbi:MAG: radical SAM protein [Thermodesulfovibrionales bacterium]|nr:radical SAM protein [Thermodesulfovibrionales bacterium]